MGLMMRLMIKKTEEVAPPIVEAPPAPMVPAYNELPTPRPGVRVQHHNGTYYVVFLHSTDLFTGAPVVIMMEEGGTRMYSVLHHYMHELTQWPDGVTRARFVDTRQLLHSKTNPEGIKP